MQVFIGKSYLHHGHYKCYCDFNQHKYLKQFVCEWSIDLSLTSFAFVHNYVSNDQLFIYLPYNQTVLFAMNNVKSTCYYLVPYLTTVTTLLLSAIQCSVNGWY